MQTSQKINKLCAKCAGKCKQASDTILLKCPNFEKKAVQMEFKFAFPKKSRKK